jgi:hypothetical protein
MGEWLLGADGLRLHGEPMTPALRLWPVECGHWTVEVVGEPNQTVRKRLALAAWGFTFAV